MRHYTKVPLTNNIQNLCFADAYMEMLQAAAQRGEKPSELFLPFSLLTSYAHDPKNQLRDKVDDIVTMIDSLFPNITLVMLIGDSLFLNNHPKPGIEAAKELISRKQALENALDLPIQALGSHNPVFEAEYQILKITPGVEAASSKRVKIASWDYYQTYEQKAFMKQVRATLQRILTLSNPEQILFDNDQLFSTQYLGFTLSLESSFNEALGIKTTDNDLHEFTSSFSLSAIAHLVSYFSLQNKIDAVNENAKREHIEVNKIKKPLLHSNNPTLLEYTKRIFDLIPHELKIASLKEYASSLSYLFDEDSLVSWILLTNPQLINISKTEPRQMCYTNPEPRVSGHHPLVRKTKKFEMAGYLRGIHPLAEWPKPKNNFHLNNNESPDNPSSSKEEGTMLRTVPVKSHPQKISSETPNGSVPSSSSLSTTQAQSKSLNEHYTDDEQTTRTGTPSSNSSLNEGGGRQPDSPNNGAMFPMEDTQEETKKLLERRLDEFTRSAAKYSLNNAGTWMLSNVQC